MRLQLVVLHMGLVVVAFLVILNGFLRGARKTQIDALLSLLWIAILVYSFFAYGWEVTALAVVMSFVYAWLSRPFARSITSRLLGYRTTLEFGGPRSPRIPSSVDELVRHADDTERRLAEIGKSKKILDVLHKKGRSVRDLKEIYYDLLATGLGDLTWEAVSNPADLELFLDLRDQGIHPKEIAARLMER